MSLPYESATSGDRALSDIQKLLRTFGCNKFASGSDEDIGEVFVQFEYRERQVLARASMRGYAAAWLRHHPYSSRMRCSKVEHEKKALAVASTAVYSILRDWIKGQLTAIETGVLTFEGAFLGQILLPTGRTVLEQAHENLLPRLTKSD